VPSGTLSVPASGGRHRLAFAGRISATQRLLPGAYVVLVTASNSHGRSHGYILAFTIVR
jgi:hypothetical protein